MQQGQQPQGNMMHMQQQPQPGRVMNTPATAMRAPFMQGGMQQQQMNAAQQPNQFVARGAMPNTAAQQQAVRMQHQMAIQQQQQLQQQQQQHNMGQQQQHNQHYHQQF